MTLSDETLMPWGKHEGTPLINVPVGYIDWLWTSIQAKHPLRRNGFEKAFLDYCKEMEQALKKERS